MKATPAEQAILKKYSEDWPALEAWLSQVDIKIEKTGYKRSDLIPKENVFTYIITITRGDKSISFDYTGPVNDYWYLTGARHTSGKLYGKRKGQTPSPMLYSVLCCVGSDYHCPDNFPDFCSEYGYDEDSIKAFNLFNDCVKLARKLRQVVTAEEVGAFPS